MAEKKKGSQEGQAPQASQSSAQAPAAAQPNPIATLLGWAGPKRVLYVVSVLLAIIGVAGGIVPYVAAGHMVAEVLDGTRDFAVYLRWCSIAAAGFLVWVVCHAASTTLSHRATFAVIAGMRRRVADKLTRTPLGYVLDTPSGKLKNVLVERIDAIETSLAHAVPEMTSDLIVPIAVTVYMFNLNWILALVGLLTIPVGLFCYMQMMNDYEQWYGETVRTGNEMASASVEYVDGIEVIKAFGRSASSYRKFSDACFAYAHSFIDWMAHCQIWQDLGLAIAPASLVTVLPVGCGMVMAGWVDPADFIMVAVLSVGVFPSLYAAMSFIDSLAQVGTVVGEIDAVLSQPDQVRASEPAALHAPDGSALAPGSAPVIELSGVHFSYGRRGGEGDPVEVIHGVDLDIQPGRVTALVGPSGSGKSTLARLIAGFWDPTAGEVRLGGAPLTGCTAEQVMAQIAYVAQDNYLFADTVMENIRMGRPGATDDEVVAAARACGCDEFIRALDRGYQTVVGGAGGHLSGGERQRVAICRAMLKDAPIVILDEATAYTDPENEAVVERAVSRLVRGKTLIVIAHRLSTVADADEIVVVDGGRIAARGTHEELLRTCPLYADMWAAHVDARDTADGAAATSTDKAMA